MIQQSEKDTLSDEELKLADDIALAIEEWDKINPLAIVSVDYILVKSLIKAGWRKNAEQ